jgi:hypothetical protein
MDPIIKAVKFFIAVGFFLGMIPLVMILIEVNKHCPALLE